MHSTTTATRKPSATSLVRHAVLFSLCATGLGLGGCNNAGEGALSGAALGAGVGAVIGSFTGSAGRGALIGAAGGALGGAVIGDQNERAAQNRGSGGSGYYR